jgi:hypothetical protein
VAENIISRRNVLIAVTGVAAGTIGTMTKAHAKASQKAGPSSFV